MTVSCSESFLDREPTDALSPSILEDGGRQLGSHWLLSPTLQPIPPRGDVVLDTALTMPSAITTTRITAIGNGDSCIGRSVHNYFTYTQIRTCNEYLKQENTINFSSEAKRNMYRAEVQNDQSSVALLPEYMCMATSHSPRMFMRPMIDGTTLNKKTLLSYIKKEMEDVIQYLPAKADAGRITSGAAQAFLVRVCLYMGEYAEAAQVAKPDY